MCRLPVIRITMALGVLAGALAWIPSATRAAPAVGDRVSVAATLPDGKPVSLEAAQGRRALVVLWSPKSLPWRKSMGELERFAASPEAASTFLLTLSVDGDVASLREFMKARGLTFPVAMRGVDNIGPLSERQLPLLLVIDAQGRLERHHTGMFAGRTLRDLLDPPAR